MSENQAPQARADAEIPQVELAEGELESVSGGTIGDIVDLIDKLVDAVNPLT